MSDDDETTTISKIFGQVSAVLLGIGLILLGYQHQLVGNGGMHTFLQVMGVILILGAA